LLFLLFSLLNPVYAQSSTDDLGVDYVDVVEGDTVPFSGKLFTIEAVATILANQEAELQAARVTCEYDISKQELDLTLKYDILSSRYNSEVLMYTTMIEARDEELKKAARKDLLQKWGVYGGFILGATSSIAIFYSVQSY
jgi:hypothetical protein